VRRVLGDQFADLWECVVAGINAGQFKGYDIIDYKVLATMMSGE
jgi:hypothetical protein